MLAFIGFAGFNNEANAQELCPGVPFDNGWVRFDVTPSTTAGSIPTFTAGLSASVETDGTATFGGLDWLYNDDSFSAATNPSQPSQPGVNTTTVGTQLVGWWSQAGGRSTHVQVTNSATVGTQSSELGIDAFSAPLPLSIHVQLLDANCVEVLDFCDTYTPNDTHVYDLANIVTNAGVDVPEAQIAGKEGIITITPVVSCPTDDRAIAYDFLHGSSRMINASGPYDFGVNLWARDTDATFGCSETVNTVNSGGGNAAILDGTPGECELRTLDPSLLSQNFSLFPGSTAARADVVLISIQDAYNDTQPTLGYTPLAALSTFFPDIVDVSETPVSCPSQPVCFARLGIDDAVLNTDTPLPTPTPTPSPSPSPGASPSPGTSPGASPTPSTSPGGGGGGGGCAISGVAGGSASAGALADILIPLLPVFGFGLARVASRRRKEEK